MTILEIVLIYIHGSETDRLRSFYEQEMPFFGPDLAQIEEIAEPSFERVEALNVYFGLFIAAQVFQLVLTIDAVLSVCISSTGPTLF